MAKHITIPANASVVGLALLSGGYLSPVLNSKAFSLPPWAATISLLFGFLFLACFMAQYVYRLFQEIKLDTMKNERFQSDTIHMQHMQSQKLLLRKSRLQTGEYHSINESVLTLVNADVEHVRQPIVMKPKSKKVKKSKPGKLNDGVIETQ